MQKLRLIFEKDGVKVIIPVSDVTITAFEVITPEYGTTAFTSFPNDSTADINLRWRLSSGVPGSTHRVYFDSFKVERTLNGVEVTETPEDKPHRERDHVDPTMLNPTKI